MSYIYKVTNNINGRAYIGVTKHSPEDRWAQHLSDAHKDRCKERPLYKAIYQYGAENFTIETIEECDPAIAFEREIFWIDHYDTFRNGYNATFGGGGKSIIDYGMVYETYKQLGCNCKRTSELLGIDKGWTSIIVRSLSGKEALDKPNPAGKRINMFSLDGQYLRTFSSSREAARYLIQHCGLNQNYEGGYSSHIIQACKGKRSTANGYKWEYAA